MTEGYTPAEDLLPEPEYYDERGQTKDENTEMKNLDDWEQTPDGFVKPPEEETSFIDDLPDAPDTLVSLAKEDTIKSCYKFLEDNGYTVDKDAHLKNKALFILSYDNKLGIMYQDKIIYLTYLKNPSQFLLPTTIASNVGKGGASFVRDVLGIKQKQMLSILVNFLK